MIELLFWIVFLLLVHPYLLYPLTLLLLGAFKKNLQDAEITDYPQVSIIVSAYNEEKVIAQRIKNCNELDYPKDKIDILIGSDGSSDRTNEIVESLAQDNLRFHAFGRQGKSKTINALTQHATGEILVYTDANTDFKPDAIKELVKKIADENVGAVSGRLKLVSKDSHGEKGEGFYWKFETMLKKLESKLGIVQGGNGAIYAIKKEYFIPLTDKTINDDFTISMNAYRFGKRMVYAEDAIAEEETAKNMDAEVRRHVRDATGHFIAITGLGFMLNPAVGLPSYAYWSHRLLRWFFPFLMAGLFLLNLMLLNQWTYILIFLGQIAFYFAGAYAWFDYRSSGKSGPLFSIYYFLLINGCMIIGLYKMLSGQAKPTWDSTAR